MKHINNRVIILSAIGFSLLFVFSASTLQNANAHQKQLVSIGGKDYLLIAGSANEPVFIDDKSGVEFFAYSPDPNDPLSSDSNNTKPIGDLEKTLKVEVSAGDKKKVLDFEPVEDEAGHYIATFFPTVETTYNYRIFGNVSNTPISLTWTCSPGSVDEDTVLSNTTTKVSDGVELKSVVGGFPCPEPRSDESFPEQYISNSDMNNKITSLQNEVSQISQNLTNIVSSIKQNAK